jgi:hypothetical protein
MLLKPTEEEPEPWALESAQFTALRLLNREVKVVIWHIQQLTHRLTRSLCFSQVMLQGSDGVSNLFGTIDYPKGEHGQVCSLRPHSFSLHHRQHHSQAAGARLCQICARPAPSCL